MGCSCMPAEHASSSMLVELTLLLPLKVGHIKTDPRCSQGVHAALTKILSIVVAGQLVKEVSPTLSEMERVL